MSVRHATQVCRRMRRCNINAPDCARTQLRVGGGPDSNRLHWLRTSQATGDHADRGRDKDDMYETITQLYDIGIPTLKSGRSTPHAHLHNPRPTARPNRSTDASPLFCIASPPQAPLTTSDVGQASGCRVPRPTESCRRLPSNVAPHQRINQPTLFLFSFIFGIIIGINLHHYTLYGTHGASATIPASEERGHGTAALRTEGLKDSAHDSWESPRDRGSGGLAARMCLACLERGHGRQLTEPPTEQPRSTASRRVRVRSVSKRPPPPTSSCPTDLCEGTRGLVRCLSVSNQSARLVPSVPVQHMCIPPFFSPPHSPTTSATSHHHTPTHTSHRPSHLYTTPKQQCSNTHAPLRSRHLTNCVDRRYPAVAYVPYHTITEHLSKYIESIFLSHQIIGCTKSASQKHAWTILGQSRAASGERSEPHS